MRHVPDSRLQLLALFYTAPTLIPFVTFCQHIPKLWLLSLNHQSLRHFLGYPLYDHGVFHQTGSRNQCHLVKDSILKS